MRGLIIVLATIAISLLSGCIDFVVTKRHLSRHQYHRQDADMIDEDTMAGRQMDDYGEYEDYGKLMDSSPARKTMQSSTKRRGSNSYRTTINTVLKPTTPRRRRISRLQRKKPLLSKIDFWLDSINEALPEEPFTCGQWENRDSQYRLVNKPAIPRNRSKRFVINGDKAIPTDFPYFLKLVVHQNDETYYYCGAVLITRKYALTSNNCFYQEEKNGLHISNVELHSTTVLENWDNESVPVFRVGRVCPMPLPYEDMAIIRLAKPIAKFTSTLYPICLPLESPPYGNVVVAVGFGYNESSIRLPEADQDANNLRFFLTSRVKCHEEAQPEETCFKPKVDKHHHGRACTGDLGGPIVKIQPRAESLMGLVLGSSPPCEEREGIIGTIHSLDLFSMGNKLDKYINDC